MCTKPDVRPQGAEQMGMNNISHSDHGKHGMATMTVGKPHLAALAPTPQCWSNVTCVHCSNGSAGADVGRALAGGRKLLTGDDWYPAVTPRVPPQVTGAHVADCRPKPLGLLKAGGFVRN
jgi:hypothetical protein